MQNDVLLHEMSKSQNDPRGPIVLYACGLRTVPAAFPCGTVSACPGLTFRRWTVVMTAVVWSPTLRGVLGPTASRPVTAMWD